MLILVPTYANKPQYFKSDIPLKKNVLIMPPITFIEFMGYEGKINEEFMDSVHLARTASNIIKNRGELNARANDSKSIIKTDYNYSTKEFKKRTKRKNKFPPSNLDSYL